MVDLEALPEEESASERSPQVDWSVGKTSTIHGKGFETGWVAPGWDQDSEFIPETWKGHLLDFAPPSIPKRMPYKREVQPCFLATRCASPLLALPGALQAHPVGGTLAGCHRALRTHLCAPQQTCTAGTPKSCSRLRCKHGVFASPINPLPNSSRPGFRDWPYTY